MERRKVLQISGVLCSSGLAGCSGQVEEAARTTEGPETTESDGTKREIVERYDDGLERANSGLEKLDEAFTAWENEDYGIAEIRYRGAKKLYGDAVSEFSAALDLTYGVDNEDAREICEEAYEWAKLRRSFAHNYMKAAEEAKSGDYEGAEGFAEEGNEDEDEIQELSPRGTQALVSALGLSG